MTQVEEIKNKLDIVDVVSSYVKLQKAGINYKAPCPFHGEKTPSFFVTPTRQIWHCFGCGKGGDVFKFVMEMENIDFRDALLQLAQRAGVELQYEDREKQGEKKRVLDAMAEAAKFFQKSLHSTKEGKEALEYLLKRGLTQATIEEFGIGWAPLAWNALVQHLKNKGFHDREMERAGLTIEGKRTDMKTGSKHFDRFRSRIMFPIADATGRTVAFTGRIFLPSTATQQMKDGAKETAKYVNSPQTEVYDKGKILYGLDKAKAEIRIKNWALLVEGQMDLIMAHQAGTKNTVAVSGTALTVDHLRLLRHYAETLYTCFDMDAAGDTATKRGIDLALAAGFDVRVVVLPKEKDPADFIKDHPKEWDAMLAKNRRIMDFYFESAFARHDKKSLDGKKKIADELLFQIKKLQNEVEKSHWVGELAGQLQIQEQFLIDQLKRIKVDFERIVTTVAAEESKQALKASRERALFERMVGFIYTFPAVFAQIKDAIGHIEKEIFEDDLILKDTLQHLKEQEKIPAGGFEKHAPKHLHPFLDVAVFKCEVLKENFEKEEQILAEIKYLIKELRLYYFKQKLEELKFSIQSAEKSGKTDDLKALVEDFKKTSQDLSQVLKMV